MIMLSKCPDELSENDELNGDELSGTDCIEMNQILQSSEIDVGM